MSSAEWANTSSPPPPNPILSAYEGFVRDTPLVTRYVLTTLFMTWLISLFANPHFALSNIPYYTVFRFELYRIVFSPFLCSGLLSLIFAYLTLNSSGKRLEFSLGSTAFGWLLLTIGTGTNLIFVVLCLALSALTNDEGWLHKSSSGIWTILFGIITIECVSASASQQYYHIFSVPVLTIYYPLVLFGIFSLLGGFSYADLISVAIGYAYAYGYLDRFRLDNTRFKEWEDSFLSSFTRREGWVVGHAASGSGAWNDVNNTGGGFGLFPTASNRGIRGPDGARVSTNTTGSHDVSFGGTSAPEAPSFPTSGGRPLGAAQRRSGSADTRAARLEALEKRSVVEKTTDGSSVV